MAGIAAQAAPVSPPVLTSPLYVLNLLQNTDRVYQYARRLPQYRGDLTIVWDKDFNVGVSMPVVKSFNVVVIAHGSETADM